MSQAHTPIEVFCSFAAEDARYLQQLEKHLNTLKRQGLISLWHRRQILPGIDWAKEIDSRLESASLILFLVSSDFLASDYLAGIEIQRAIEQQVANQARILPILVRPVDWQETPFAHQSPLPTNATPISTWRNRDEAWVNVVMGIRRVIGDLSLLTVNSPASTLPAILTIPYPRNPFFQGREELLAHIRSQLSTGQATALSQPQAISGLGGIGKTQLAVEYAYRFHTDYDAVFWARAESIDALTFSYVEIATELNLPEKEEQDQALIVQAVKRWLQRQRKWLLILDNADELSLLRDFLPPGLGGHLLITTRVFATGRLATRIEVSSFLPEEGSLFLLRRAGLLPPDADLGAASTQERTLAMQLTQELGGLPLALDQAGAYLEETGTSLAAYHQLYQQHHALLLKERRGGNVDDHPDSVMTTFLLSFDRLQQRSPVAAELLRFCAFLAPDAIPEELLIVGAKHLGPLLEGIEADPLLLDQAIESLRTFSLVQRDPRTSLLSIHRLVQIVLRDEMSEPETTCWVDRIIKVIAAVVPTVEHTSWSVWELLIGQILICAELVEHFQVITLEAATILALTGLYLKERARYEEAKPLLQRALAICEQQLGTEHPDTAASLNNLALLYVKQGRYSEAKPLLQRALAIREQQLGAEHPDTAISLNNLGLLYNSQGRYEEAEPLYKGALLIREQQLGTEHPDIATSLNNLAGLYIQQGRYKEAEPLLQRALLIREQQLGTEHPDIATSLNNLAELSMRQGRYEEAESLLQRTLTLCEHHLGAEHPFTAFTLNNLALLYVGQGRYSEAEPLLQRVLAICEQQLGTNHPLTARNLNNLGLLYDRQDRYSEAEPLYKRALAICEQQLETDYRFTATNLNNLALLYVRQSRYKEAEPLLQRALAICEQPLGAEHPDTAASLNNLALLYVRQGRYTEAEPLYKRALTLLEQQSGTEHPGIAASLYTLAELYVRQSRYEEAKPLLQRTLTLCEHHLGAEHPNTKTIREIYALLLRMMSQEQESE